MYCKKCGADVGDAKFCPDCGAEIAGSANEEPCYIPGEKKVNKLAYGLIAIFIGDFGIHRFYAGRWLSGIIYLLFFWTFIPGLLGLIEGIVALCRNDEDSRGDITVRPGRFFI